MLRQGEGKFFSEDSILRLLQSLVMSRFKELSLGGILSWNINAAFIKSILRFLEKRTPRNKRVDFLMSKKAFSKPKTLRNAKKLCFSIITLLLLALSVTLFITQVKAPISDYPEMPGGIPNDTVQYNKPDTTPIAEMTRIKANQPALFRYKNMTMLMNCTHNLNLIVTVDPEMTPKTLGLDIEANQTMTLTMNTSGSPLQGEQLAQRALNFYLGLEPSPEAQSKVQLRLLINQTELSQELNRAVNASELMWMYWDKTQSQWITVESHIDQNGYLVINTDHLSTWTVAEVTPTVEPPPDTTQEGLLIKYAYYIALLTVILAIGAVAIFVYIKNTTNPQPE